MSNPTDTNQASEGEINSFMKNFRSKAHVNFRKDGETVAYGWKPSDMKREITSLIRTEKLKLLAEVRERVVGEDTPEGGYTTEPYHRMKQQEIRATKILRNVQRDSLTKLEAEL